MQPLFVQINLGYGNVIVEGCTLTEPDRTKAIVWYPTEDGHQPGDTIKKEPDDFSYRDYGGVIVSFKTDEDIDRLIENLLKLRSAPIDLQPVP
jgi:hypothetical protein